MPKALNFVSDFYTNTRRQARLAALRKREEMEASVAGNPSGDVNIGSETMAESKPNDDGGQLKTTDNGGSMSVVSSIEAPKSISIVRGEIHQDTPSQPAKRTAS